MARRGGRDFPGRSGRREMHKAVCSECGNDCEVPFRPSGDKPIFCSNCFEGKERPSRRSSGGSGFGTRDNTNKQLLEQISSVNTKLDRILKVLESGDDPKPASKKLKVKKTVKKAASKDKKAETKKASKEKLKKST
jgi:CxxC-x17-CxxC domain-containing protein